MDYFFFLLLFYQILDLLVSFLSLYFSVNILFRKSILKKSLNISLTMIVNFIFTFFSAVVSIVYNLYLLIFIRIDEVIFNAKILYILGILPYILIFLNSIMEFFLCVDRCLTILFPFKYSQKFKFAVAALNVFAFFALLVAVIYVNNIISSFPTTSNTLCQNIGCFLQSSLYLKISFLFINLFGAAILAILIKFVLKTNSKSTKRMNKTVLIMVFCTTFIELAPFICAQAFFMLTGLQLQKFIGPFGFTSSTINITLSAGIYFNAFKKSFASIVQSKVTVITSTYVTSNNK